MRRSAAAIRLRAVALLVVVGLTSAHRAVGETWFSTLPWNTRTSILWRAAYERGDMTEWTRPLAEYPGGGVFNTGGLDVSFGATQYSAHSGDYAAFTRIKRAWRGVRGPRAVRLMRWTDKPWDEGGDHFPTDAYYSTWIMAPHAYRPEKDPAWNRPDDGWWNVFQFKSEDAAGDSQPTWVVNIAAAGDGQMQFYLYSPINTPASHEQAAPITFGPRQWVHLEVRYKSRIQPWGRVDVFQDGTRILSVTGVKTSLGGTTRGDQHVIWGIGNYADHISGHPHGDGHAMLYFDDSAVSTKPLHPYASGE